MNDSVTIDLSMKQVAALTLITGLFVGLTAGVGVMVLQDSGAQNAALPGSGTDVSPSDTEASGSQGSSTVSVSDLTWSDDPTLGEESAEVTLVWFSDLNCMYCRRFAQNTFPQIRDSYVDSGDVRVVKKDFITMGANSVTLAKASQAVWQMTGEENPEVFWKWSDKVSENQPERKRNSKNVTEDIISTTRTVDDIDAEKLRSRMKEVNRTEIQGDVQQGKSRGISGTPGFLIFETGTSEATVMSGAQPYSAFQTEIDKILEN